MGFLADRQVELPSLISILWAPAQASLSSEKMEQ